MTFSWRECNAGTLDAGSYDWVMSVEPENGGSYVQGSGTTPALAAGACVFHAVDIPGLAVGRYVLQVWLDPANTINEASKSNNETSDVIDVSAPF